MAKILTEASEEQLVESNERSEEGRVNNLIRRGIHLQELKFLEKILL